MTRFITNWKGLISFLGEVALRGGYPGTFFMSWWEEFCMQFPCIGVGCKVIKYSLEKNIVSLGFAVVKDADGQSDTIFSSPKWWLWIHGDESHGIPIRKKKSPYINKSKTSWWFQPIRKICSSKWESSPNFRGENKKYLKPPPPRNPRSVDVSTIGYLSFHRPNFFPNFSLYGLESGNWMSPAKKNTSLDSRFV